MDRELMTNTRNKKIGEENKEAEKERDQKVASLLSARTDTGETTKDKQQMK